MSYLIRKKGKNKSQEIEWWVEQETIDQITEKKMWNTYEIVNTANAKQESKPVTTPPEVIEFIKQKQETKTETNKPKYKPKPKK